MMNKIIYSVSLCFLFYLFIPMKNRGGNAIDCKANVSYFWNGNRLDMLISESLDDGKGFVTLSGIVHNKDKTDYYLNKTISFSYQRNKEFYNMRSEMVMDFPQMMMSATEQRKWLPDFFITEGKAMLLKIKPYGKNSWIFYSATSPIFVCEKVR